MCASSLHPFLSTTYFSVMFFFTENEFVRCPAISNPLNGTVTYNENKLKGGYPLDSEASFECDYGFAKLRTWSATCQYPDNWPYGTSEGYWSGATNPICYQSNGIQHVIVTNIPTTTSSSLFLLPIGREAHSCFEDGCLGSIFACLRAGCHGSSVPVNHGTANIHE